MGLVVQNGCRREWCECGAIAINIRELIIAVCELPVRRQLLQSSKLNGIDGLFLDVCLVVRGIVGAVAWKREKVGKLLNISATGDSEKVQRLQHVHEKFDRKGKLVH